MLKGVPIGPLVISLDLLDGHKGSNLDISLYQLEYTSHASHEIQIQKLKILVLIFLFASAALVYSEHHGYFMTWFFIKGIAPIKVLKKIWEFFRLIMLFQV